MVGSALVRKLTAEGYSNLLLRTHDELDLLNQAAVERFFTHEQPEYVFLAAAKVGGIQANTTYRGQFIYENLEIQTHVIHQAYRTGVKKLLFLGSSCIYPKMASQPIQEESLLTGPLEPTNEPYAIAKIAGITLCQAYRAQYGCNFISVMPTNLYGPHDNFDLETSHVLPALIRKFYLAAALERDDIPTLRADLDKRPIQGRNGSADADELRRLLRQYGIGQPGKGRTSHDQGQNTDLPASGFQPPVSVSLWGTGTPRREFLHVDDLADACLFLMQEYDEPDIVNIGVGEDLAIRELAEVMAGITGFQGDIQFDARHPDGTPRKVLDVSRLNALGWRALISLHEGIRSTLEWYARAHKS